MTRFPLKTVLFLILTFPSYGQTPPAPATAPGNALKNPGFETQGAGGWLNYNWGPQYGIEWNGTDDHHSGDYALKLIATGQTDDPNGYEMSGAKQVIPVHPGDILEGGVWLKWKDCKDVVSHLECRWLDVNQVELTPEQVPAPYQVGIGTPELHTGSGGWEYQTLASWSVQQRTAPPQAAFVEFRLNLLSAGAAKTATGSVWFDDAVLIVHPAGTAAK